jgi:hypothetical protein
MKNYWLNKKTDGIEIKKALGREKWYIVSIVNGDYHYLHKDGEWRLSVYLNQGLTGLYDTKEEAEIVLAKVKV